MEVRILFLLFLSIIPLPNDGVDLLADLAITRGRTVLFLLCVSTIAFWSITHCFLCFALTVCAVTVISGLDRHIGWQLWIFFFLSVVFSSSNNTSNYLN
ncbi:uncharacterized protein BDR25DRAFT_81946 [Lindgomyces ingoldianus]|uniref:Uncharacterized protein n=1 Tax=Lindgomyces ingoldianus TaxID=673940 RepID=A0ACB6QIQ0_9PLEO|nr:uncharacterized protein BDR25DRAFT_81946 [Lindgomyces ingoldianus]KAF2465997.1 hypothetical protein BDR25DRAFT_81946 [Lindgomyces ingoldianus]